MRIVDEQGDLFGVVNIIDAVVVLMVVAVGVAGIALVLNDSSPEEEEMETGPELVTTSATIDLGVIRPGVTEEIDTGDEYSAGEQSNLTITDVHLSPSDGGARVILQVQLKGENQTGGVNYAGSSVRLNRNIGITTPQYDVSGRIRDIGGGESLNRQQTSVVLTGSADTETANRITTGDTSRIAGSDTATVESVSIYRTNNPDQRQVVVGLSLNTVEYGEGPQFGTVSIQRGTRLTYRAEDYEFAGTIDRVGATEPRGTRATRTVTLSIDSAEEYVIEGIEPGLSEQTGGETTARITDVETEPSVIVREDGSVVDHPFDKDMTITTELQARETATGIRFKGERIRPGRTVTLDLGTITVEATVVRIK